MKSVERKTAEKRRDFGSPTLGMGTLSESYMRVTTSGNSSDVRYLYITYESWLVAALSEAYGLAGFEPINP